MEFTIVLSQPPRLTDGFNHLIWRHPNPKRPQHLDFLAKKES